ncbi:MAG: glycosyltransferase family 2 protein [Crocosphaera sp.]|jgi:glycosyltransferase involved in cell wall biosynthesis
MESNIVNPSLLSVVIPVYNEVATIGVVIEELAKIPYLLEIVAVNDGSKDGTQTVLNRLAQEYPQLKVIHHSKNKGKTMALKTGFRQTKGNIVIVQDADLEYNPQEIFEVISPILEEKADVVYGSRFLVRKAARVLYFSHYLANKFLTFLSNCLTNLNMTDVETCYKAFRGEIIRSMVIESQGFGFEIEVTAKVSKLKCRIYEVPISYYGRTYEEGKKIGIWDGVSAMWYIAYYNLFCPLKKSFSSLPFDYMK